MEDLEQSLTDEECNKVPESPKPMAFTIDFGDKKPVDTQRHKSLVEKYQKRHRRGQSLSKLEEPTNPSPAPAPSRKHPLSANLPRRANFQSEGYSSSDERGDRQRYVRSASSARTRDSLSLPLKNVHGDKMTQSCTLPSIESPEVELRDVVTPDLDLISPFSPQNHGNLSPPSYETTIRYTQLSSPECETKKTPDQFVPGTEFDFDKSDAVSDAGTYTLDADNYSEEQKARMSIDQDFKIEEVSVFRKTQEYVQSLSSYNNVTVRKKTHVEQIVQNNISDEPEPQKPLHFLQNNSQRPKNKLSPIVSPTQNLSIIQNTEHQTGKSSFEDLNKSFTKIMFPSPKAKTGIGLDNSLDQGSVISVTSSGAFRSKSDKDKVQMKLLSLSKSEVQVEAYTDNVCRELPKPVEKPRSNLSANLVLVSENVPKPNNNSDKYKNGMEKEPAKLVNLPPPVGGISGKVSPTKIPSPVHTSRPRSRNSSNSLNIDLSDSSLETESYLKPTQNLLHSLQQRLSLDSDHDSDNDAKYLNNDARNLLKKPTHMRHNSLDDRNLKISNKLEHFQTKNFIDQTYANVLNQYSHSKIHKIQNSPNNSPIRRSSSFSTKNQINTKCSNIPHKESNLQNSPAFTRNGSIQRSSSTASIRPTLMLRRSSINSDHKIDRSQFGDTESSSEEDLKTFKKKDITNTRYNRAFSLRRARLDTEPSPPLPKCPNTPEMRRKFQPTETRAERAISVDRRPVKSNDVQSRYLLNITKGKAPVAPAKVEAKGSPKIGNLATKPAPKPNVFSRTDSGRFSMRTTKPIVTNSQKTIRKEIQGKKPSGPRSNSSLTSKEVEFQNWKRRKSYDPMKAAAEGKKKAELAKKQSQSSMTQSYHEANQDCDSSPSHSSSVHRSQSFHGTAALEQYISSEEEEDLTLSADEGFSPPTPSPCDLSPNRVVRYAWKDQLLH